MKVIILCGGQGTRIRDANELLPKPLLPIGDRPMVWHIMKSYAAHGYNDFVLALGFKGWLIKEYFLNYRSMTADLRVSLGRNDAVEVLHRRGVEDWNVTLAETGEAAMTGARVASLRRYVEGDDLFMVTYGDGVSNVDIGKLVAFHRAHGKVATVTAVHPPGRFGELGIQDGFVREFNEKPQTTLGFINGGFFMVEAKRIWDQTCRRAQRRSSSRIRCGASRTRVSSWPTRTRATGSRWTRCASTPCSTTSGRAGARPGRAGTTPTG